MAFNFAGTKARDQVLSNFYSISSSQREKTPRERRNDHFVIYSSHCKDALGPFMFQKSVFFTKSDSYHLLHSKFSVLNMIVEFFYN